MNFWLIDQFAFADYVRARSSGQPNFSVERFEEIRANADKWAGAGYAAENLRVKDGQAIIPIQGVLLDSASEWDRFIAEVFGETFTTYAGLKNQIRAAEANPEVESILYVIDSPGGTVKGVDSAAAEIAAGTKPKQAISSGLVASAAYYLASQADTIIAQDKLAMFGSIGVVVDLMDASEYYSEMGVKFYSITSKEAPMKRPEPHSEEFKNSIQSRVDSIHEQFVSTVASGRSKALGREVTTSEVNKDFGRGDVMLAGLAKTKGMIDAVESALSKPKEETTMSDSKKPAGNTEALEAARKDGVEMERARVGSLLAWLSADSERVIEAIEKGEELTPNLFKELSEKASARAIEEGRAAAKAEADKAREEALASVKEDKAPEVKGTEAQGNAGDALYAAAAKSSKIKVKGEK